VLAADDSKVMRGVLRTVFDLHAGQGDTGLPRMELCGLVQDGAEAIAAVRTLAPDVLLLDLEMPRLNGLQVLEQLRTLAPRLPVIMCSAQTERGARSTLDALALGARDYVMKPGQQTDFASALDLLMQQLLPKIAVLASVGWSSPAARDAPRETTRDAAPVPLTRLEPASESSAPVAIVTIGISTGGPSALELMLPMLPKDFPVPLMIVQHMPKLFTGALAERLNRLCSMRVEQARDGAAVQPGTILLAPGDAHMEVVALGGGALGRSRGSVVRLHRGPPLNSCMPSVDYLLKSAASVYGAGALAVIMTGMGSDGLAGAKAVKAARGTVLAQDEATSAVWGMPGRVAQAGIASATLPLPLLAGAIIDRVQAGRPQPRPISYDFQREPAHGLL
jgi:two-component system chemotaxis response regulator CheB